MPIATRDPQTPAESFPAADSAAKMLVEQDRALRRILGPSIGEYFRTQDQLRRAVAHIDRFAVADLSASARAVNAGSVKAAADARRWSPAYASSGAAARIAQQVRNSQLLAERRSLVPPGTVKAALVAQRLAAGSSFATANARLVADVRGRRKLIGEQTTADVAKLSGIASAAARRSVARSASAALLEIATQIRQHQRLITEQNSALLATMSIKRSVVMPAAIASIVDRRALAASAVIGDALTRGSAEQLRGIRDLLGENSSAVFAAESLRCTLLPSQLATSSIGAGFFASQLARQSIANAYNVRASLPGPLLDSLRSAPWRDWLSSDEPPTWDEITGAALRELRAELKGERLGYVLPLHLAFFLLEVMLVTTPALPLTTREKIAEAFFLAHAIELAVTGYRRTIR